MCPPREKPVKQAEATPEAVEELANEAALQNQHLEHPVQVPNEPAHIPNHRRLAAKFDRAHNYMGFWWTSCATVLATAILVAWVPSLLSPEPPKGNVDGKVHPQFKKVKEILRLHLLSSEEKGAALAVYYRGEPVVDIWGGYADIEAWQPWQNHTVSNIFTLYHSVISLSLALLSQRGHINYDTPISNYWPEFSVHGKESVTIRQLLMDRADLHLLNQSISLSDTNKPDLSNFLANQTREPPGWFYRFGDSSILEVYADQIVQRTDPKRRNLKQYFTDEFITPLGIKDFNIGLPTSEHHRTARVKGHSMGVLFDGIFAPLELGHTLVSYIKSFSAFKEINAITRLNDPEIRTSGVGSVSTFTSARSFAQLYSNSILTPQTNSSLLLSPETWAESSIPANEEPSLLPKILHPYFLADYRQSAAGHIRYSPKKSELIGFSGIGGQYIYVDLEANLSICYLTNYNTIYKSGLDPRFIAILRGLYDCV